MAIVLTFKEWQVFMVENTPQDQDITCPYCNGDGVLYEECCECGHEKEEECGTCDAMGIITIGELTPGQQIQSFTRAKYVEQLTKDLKKLAGWTGIKYKKLLNENGYDLITVDCGRIKNEKVVPLKKIG